MKKGIVFVCGLLTLLTFIFALSVPSSSGQTCTVPTDGMRFYQDTLLCPGTYYLPNGVRINASGMTLDCQGATIIGQNILNSVGIFNSGYDNVVIKSCNVRNFNYAGIHVSSYYVGSQIVSPVNNFLYNNTANSNARYGFSIYGSHNNTLASNSAKNNGWEGFSVYISSNNTLISNTAENNSYVGFAVTHSTHNTLASNVAFRNGYEGIWLYNAHYIAIKDNIAKGNLRYGMLVDSSRNNTISSNHVGGNTQGGINIRGSVVQRANNTVSDNFIVGNGGAGLRIGLTGNVFDSAGNLIYNNFFSNILNVVDQTNISKAPLTNKWNTTKDCTRRNIIGGPCVGGNFWHDYAGKDLDGDGIGDTLLPYNSNGNILIGGDFLPLVQLRIMYKSP